MFPASVRPEPQLRPLPYHRFEFRGIPLRNFVRRYPLLPVVNEFKTGRIVCPPYLVDVYEIDRHAEAQSHVFQPIVKRSRLTEKVVPVVPMEPRRRLVGDETYPHPDTLLPVADYMAQDDRHGDGFHAHSRPDAAVKHVHHPVMERFVHSDGFPTLSVAEGIGNEIFP